MEAHGRGTPTSSTASLVVPPVRRSFAHKNTAAGEARMVLRQKCISGDPYRQVVAARMPFTASGQRCSEVLYADQVGNRLHGGFGLVARLVYTQKAICGVGVPPGSRTWHIARIFKIFGMKRRQCKVVRRDALHAPTPRSALPRLQPNWFSFDSFVITINGLLRKI